VIFIAEVGMNHNGNFDLAYELIKQSKYAGADIVKFQLGWRDGPGEINQITPEVISKLRLWAERFEVELMFSIISTEAYATIKGADFGKYKIASRTVKDHPDLVRMVLDEGKLTYVSLGMWDGEDVPFHGYDNARYLWCKSLYPTHPWDIVDLPKDFTFSPYCGYSDHTIGIETPLLAIARGAQVIEKHFTLDKSDKTIRDHILSATPDEYLQMTRIGREIRRNILLGI